MWLQTIQHSSNSLDQSDEETIRVKNSGQQPQCTFGCEATVKPFGSGRSHNTLLEKRFNEALKRNHPRLRTFIQNGGNNLLVLFRLQRASRVNDAPTHPNGAHRRGKNRALPLRLASQILLPKPMANLRIAAQCACPAARHIGQRKVEDSIFAQRCRVGVPAFDAVADASQSIAQLRNSVRTRLAGNDSGLWIALGQNQRLASGSGTGIQNHFAAPVESPLRRDFGHQLRTFVLKSNAALVKRRRRSHISGDNRSRARQQFTRFKLDSRLELVPPQRRHPQCAPSTRAESARGGKLCAPLPVRRSSPIAPPSRRDEPGPAPTPLRSFRKLERRSLCESLRSTAFTIPDAKRCPACLASSTLSSIAARAGMRSRCSS